MSNFETVILAAGMGTRMKSKMPKVLHKICGKALAEWVLEAAKNAGSEKNICVIGHGADMAKENLEGKCEFALQSEQKGTGHAVMQTISQLTEKYTVVLNGDAPLIREETVKEAVEYHEKSGGSITVITAKTENPFGYGRVVRDENGNVTKIVEQKDASENELEINEINSGMYVFTTEDLLFALDKITPNNAQGEYYLTDTLEILINAGKKAGAFAVSDFDETRGINDRVQLSEAEEIMRDRILKIHMRNGVTIRNPKSVTIEGGVLIGEDTEIEQNVIIKSGTVIGKNCHIGMGSALDGAKIGDGVKILSSMILNSSVGDGTTVGPFAYIRPDCTVGKKARIGDFVELKNCVIGDGTKVSHLTYVGDSDVGSNCNFGCGTVTVNYDGKKKYRTVIGNNVFVGCNSNLVAPVTLEDGAYTAAGSTITDTVPENQLAIARARQVNKKDWKDRRK